MKNRFEKRAAGRKNPGRTVGITPAQMALIKAKNLDLGAIVRIYLDTLFTHEFDKEYSELKKLDSDK